MRPQPSTSTGSQLAGLDQLGDPQLRRRRPAAGSSRAGRARRRPRAPAPAIRSSSRWASSDAGVGAASTVARDAPARAGRRAARSAAAGPPSPARSRTATRSPAWSPTSPTTARCAAGASPRAPRPRSARARAPARGRCSTSSGRSSWTRSMLPQASCSARSIRQRSSGWRSTPISDASCPQYSNSRRGARWESRSSARGGVRPEPAERGQVVRALEHVDRVDLQQRDPLEHPAQIPPRPARRPGAGRRSPARRAPAAAPRRRRCADGGCGSLAARRPILKSAIGDNPAHGQGSVRSGGGDRGDHGGYVLGAVGSLRLGRALGTPRRPAPSSAPCPKHARPRRLRCGTIKVPYERADPSLGTTRVRFAVRRRGDTGAPAKRADLRGRGRAGLRLDLQRPLLHPHVRAGARGATTSCWSTCAAPGTRGRSTARSSSRATAPTARASPSAPGSSATTTTSYRTSAAADDIDDVRRSARARPDRPLRRLVRHLPGPVLRLPARRLARRAGPRQRLPGARREPLVSEPVAERDPRPADRLQPRRGVLGQRVPPPAAAWSRCCVGRPVASGRCSTRSPPAATSPRCATSSRSTRRSAPTCMATAGPTSA